MGQSEHWIPLKQAAALVGVDEGTLRHWADLGKVRTFRTPGGHRRFLEEDLRALVSPDAPADIAAAIRERRILAGPSAKRLQAAEWYASLDERFRAKARERGMRLVELLGQSARGVPVLEQVRALGREYGAELRVAGLTLVQATEAFCFFRDTVLARATRSAEAKVVREMSRLLDEVLLAIVRTYDRG